MRALVGEQVVDVNQAAPDGATALHWAVHRNDAGLVDLLIAAGADVAAANRYGVQPISLAAENGNAAILEALLDAGADPNATLPEGETVLMTAAPHRRRRVGSRVARPAGPIRTPVTAFAARRR